MEVELFERRRECAVPFLMSEASLTSIKRQVDDGLGDPTIQNTSRCDSLPASPSSLVFE